MKPKPIQRRLLIRLAWTPIAACLCAGDWPQFRGPAGRGVASGPEPPTAWSSQSNLLWRLELPGAGASSPIVIGDKVFVTCYSGYGVDAFDPGQKDDLKRHVICVDARDGKILWDKAVPGADNEDPYTRNLGQHGYATHTPVSDGRRVYAFLSKSGVRAFDFNGRALWSADVGQESGRQGWGSAASPILYQDLVIVNAADESQSLRGLRAANGEEVWRAEAGSLSNVYNTPALVTPPRGEAELAVAVPYEVWGLNPKTGKLKWFAETGLSGNMNASIQASKGVIYVSGGNRGGGLVAVRSGGEGDVTQTRALWSSRRGPDFGSPLLHNGYLYWVTSRGTAHCVNADLVFEERLEADGFAGVYASSVLAGDKIYVVGRDGGVAVLAARPQFQQLAYNRFTGDPTDFNATPAVSDGRLFLRSNLYLYCVAKD